MRSGAPQVASVVSRWLSSVRLQRLDPAGQHQGPLARRQRVPPTVHGSIRNSSSSAEAPTHNASRRVPVSTWTRQDRKSTRLNSSHSQISYAVFCLTKKTSSSV